MLHLYLVYLLGRSWLQLLINYLPRSRRIPRSIQMVEQSSPELGLEQIPADTNSEYYAGYLGARPR